jgi:hypothetical protein
MAQEDNMSNHKAIVEYTVKMQAIKSMLADLEQYADDMGGVSPDEVNWADVGTAGHVLEMLRETLNFVYPQEAA